MQLTKRAAAGGALALAASAALAQRVTPTTSPFSEAASVLDHVVAQGTVPWAVLLVTAPDRVLFTHAAGVEVGHVDVLRSATKIATVTAVMTLVQSGAASLDDPVSRYVPAFRADKGDIRLRHLLAMNSGLPFSWRGFSDDTPLAQAADAIAAAPLAARPGARFISGNLGLTVAGRVAEVVSGQEWDQFFRRTLAEPLGLNFAYGPLDMGRLGGGGRTDAESYGKLLRLHLNGGLHEDRRILSQHLVQEMQRSNGSVFVNPLVQIKPHGYGLGWWFDAVDAEGQATVISNPGAWGAYPWIDLRRGYGAFLFVRKRLDEGVAIQREVQPIVERAFRPR